MPVERVAECLWNQWPNGRGMGGRITVEFAEYPPDRIKREEQASQNTAAEPSNDNRLKQPDIELQEARAWYVNYTNEFAAKGDENAKAWLERNADKVSAAEQYEKLKAEQEKGAAREAEPVNHAEREQQPDLLADKQKPEGERLQRMAGRYDPLNAEHEKAQAEQEAKRQADTRADIGTNHEDHANRQQQDDNRDPIQRSLDEHNERKRQEESARSYKENTEGGSKASDKDRNLTPEEIRAQRLDRAKERLKELYGDIGGNDNKERGRRRESERENDKSRGYGGTPRQGRKRNQGGGEYDRGRHKHSTAARAAAYLKLCRNPLQDLRGWLDEDRGRRGASRRLSSGQGEGISATEFLQQIRAGGRFTHKLGAVGKGRRAFSTGRRVAAYLKLCRAPLKDLKGWTKAGSGRATAPDKPATALNERGKEARSSPRATFQPASRAAVNRPSRGEAGATAAPLTGLAEGATARAAAASQEEADKWQGLIDAAAQDVCLSREQRAAAIAGLRMRQQAAAKAALQRVMEDEQAKANAFRRTQRPAVPLRRLTA